MVTKKYYETREFKLLKDEWYERLAEEGFEDIEDDIEWRLKGSTASVSLAALKAELPNEHTAHDIHEVLASDSDLLQYNDSRKAVYFHVAGQVVSQGYRERLDPLMLDVWSRHCQGEGERVIAHGLKIARSKVRAFIHILKKTVEGEMTPSK